MLDLYLNIKQKKKIDKFIHSKLKIISTFKPNLYILHFPALLFLIGRGNIYLLKLFPFIWRGYGTHDEFNGVGFYKCSQ